MLYKILGSNLKTLYFAGGICSFAIVSGIYIIAKKFLSEFASFSLAVFTIVSGVCAPHLFNYTLPYSYSMLYGTVSFIYSLFALIKYGETKKTYFLYISALLAGLCITNKYDFYLYALLILFIAIFSKNKRLILNSITCIIAIPTLFALILLLQGVNMNDYIKAFEDVCALISSKTLSYFYTIQGVFFQKAIFKVWAVNILKTLGCCGLLLGSVKLLDKNRVLGWCAVAVSSAILFYLTTPLIFVFMVPFTILLAIILSNRLKSDMTLIYLILGVLAVSGKSFWVLLSLNYGNYVIPLILLTFLAVLFTAVDKKYEKAFVVGLLVISLNTLIAFSQSRMVFNQKISTDKGTIYSSIKNANTTNRLIDSIKGSDIKTAVIYPEGLIINFLTGTESHDYMNSMLPLYVESLNEQRIINHIEDMNPDVIVLTNANMKEYGVEYICENYAFDFKDYLTENYTNVDDIIYDNFHYLVFAKTKESSTK